MSNSINQLFQTSVKQWPLCCQFHFIPLFGPDKHVKIYTRCQEWNNYLNWWVVPHYTIGQPLPKNLWNKVDISWNSRFHVLIATHKLPLPFICNSIVIHTHSSQLLRPWKWRQQPPTKRRYLFTHRHGVISQKNWMSILNKYERWHTSLNLPTSVLTIM